MKSSTEEKQEPSADSRPAQPDVVVVGDEHKTHAWTKWRPVGIFLATEQQRSCVVCGFIQRAGYGVAS